MSDFVKEKKPNRTQSNKPAPQRTGNQYPQGDKTDRWRADSSAADVPNTQSPRSQSHREHPPSAQQRQAQPPSGMFNAAAVKAQWKQMLNSAKRAWSKLTDAELRTTGGDEQKLTGLVKERYDIPREEANKQVKSFFSNNADNTNADK